MGKQSGRNRCAGHVISHSNSDLGITCDLSQRLVWSDLALG